MIAVLVCDEDGVQRFDVLPNRGQTPGDFAAA